MKSARRRHPFSRQATRLSGWLRAALALCALCNLGTTVLLYRIGSRLGGRPLALALLTGWLWMLSTWKPFLSAMETSLYLLVFTIFLNQLIG